MLTDFQREKYWVKWMAPLEGKHCHRQEKQPCLSFTNWGNQQILGMLYSDRAQEMQSFLQFSELSLFSAKYITWICVSNGGGRKCKKKRQLPSIPWFVYLSGSWEISPVQHPGFLRLAKTQGKVEISAPHRRMLCSEMAQHRGTHAPTQASKQQPWPASPSPRLSPELWASQKSRM